MTILLTTLNVKYPHTALALRYLFANLGELQHQTQILEFIITDPIADIAEKLLTQKPKIIGISVYIWNAEPVAKLIKLIKALSPQTSIVLGGPEVSFRPFRVDFEAADYMIQGEGELSFYTLCTQILQGCPPSEKERPAPLIDLESIHLPYPFYSDEDIKNRMIVIETSRGCPFSCDFCLSSMDTTVRYFNLTQVLNEIDALWQRGARQFKWIDRSVNINHSTAIRLLDYFLTKPEPYFVHFEMVPHLFSDALKQKLKQFPPNSIQLEIGIQTLNPSTAERIHRPCDRDTTIQNLQFLKAETNVYVHADLIMGLPGETLDHISQTIDQLVAVTNGEIQMGILKKLSGTALAKFDDAFGMIYSDTPPYEILQTNTLSFETMQRLKRFARFWEITYNSGNFKKSIQYLWPNGRVFDGFYTFSEWIYAQTESTWHFSLDRLAELLFTFLTQQRHQNPDQIATLISQDILSIPGRKLPKFLKLRNQTFS